MPIGNVTSAEVSFSDNAPTVPVPAGAVAGNRYIWAVLNASLVTFPAGWTPLPASPTIDATLGSYLNVAVRTYDGTEGSDFLASSASYGQWMSVCAVIDGVGAGGLEDSDMVGAFIGYITSGNPVALNGPAVTVSAAGKQIIWIGSSGSSGVTATATNVQPAGFSAPVGSSPANGRTIFFSYLESASAGTPSYNGSTSFNADDSRGAHVATLVFDGGGGGGGTPAIDQEGFRFGADNGSESAHSWLANQDTNVNAEVGTAVLIRNLLNATNDPASATFSIRAQKNGAGGYNLVPVGPGNAEAYAQPTWGAAGTAASGTTSCTPSYPAGISATTSHLFCVVTGRSNTAGTAPAITGGGWTIRPDLEGGTGTWGVDLGPRRVTVFQKDTVTGSESGTITVTLAGTTANTLRATIFRVEVPTGYVLDVEHTTGADTTNGTGYSATGSGTLTLDANRLLIVATAQNIDTGTATSRAVSAAGITFGTLTNRADTAVTNGNDHRHIINSIPVSSGSDTVAPTFSYTISASGSGPTAFLSLRARLPAVTNELYIADSTNIAATGVATTARQTPPAGKDGTSFQAGRLLDDANTWTGDLATGTWTDLGFCVKTQAPAVVTDYYDFRVYVDGAPLDTYSATGRLTLVSGGGGGGSGFSDDFEASGGTGALDGWTIFQPGSGPTPSRIGGRYDSGSIAAVGSTTWFNADRGVAVWKLVPFPTSGQPDKEIIFHNVGVGPTADPTGELTYVDASHYALAGAVVHDENTANINYEFLVVGHRGADGQYTLETKTTTAGSSQVSDVGDNAVGAGVTHADIRLLMRDDNTVRWYYRAVGDTIWIAINTTGVAGVAHGGGFTFSSGSAYVGFVTYAFSAVPTAFRGVADAIELVGETFSPTPITLSLDAVLQVARSLSASASAAVQQGHTATASVSAVLQQTRQATASLESAVQQALTSISNLQTAVQFSDTRSAGADAAIQTAQSATSSIQSVVEAVGTQSNALEAAIQRAASLTAQLSTAISSAASNETSIDSVVQSSGDESASVSAGVQTTASGASSVDSVVQAAREALASISLAVQQAREASASVQTAVLATTTAQVGINTQVQAGSQENALFDTAIQDTQSGATQADLAIQLALSTASAVSVAVRESRSIASAIETAILQTRNAQVGVDAMVQGGQTLVTALQSAVQDTQDAATGVDAALETGYSSGLSIDTQIQASSTQTVSLSALVLSAFSITAQIEAAIQATRSIGASVDTSVQIARLELAAVQAAIQEVRSSSVGLSAQVQGQSSRVAAVDAALQQAFTSVAVIDAAISEVFNASASLNALIAETFSQASQISAAVLYVRNAQTSFSIYIDDPALAPVQEREVYVPAENREIAIEADVREIDIPSEIREIRVPTEEEMNSVPWTPPVFHIHSGATLDYLWKWADWLNAIGDAIESFEVIPGEYLSLVSSSQETSNVRGFLMADPELNTRKRTLAHCKIVTVGIAGAKRTDIRDIIIHIRPCGLPV